MKAWTTQKKNLLIAKAGFDLPLPATSRGSYEKRPTSRLLGGEEVHIRRAGFLIILETADKNILHLGLEKV